MIYKASADLIAIRLPEPFTIYYAALGLSALQHTDCYKDEFLVKSLARYMQRDKMIVKI